MGEQDIGRWEIPDLNKYQREPSQALRVLDGVASRSVAAGARRSRFWGARARWTPRRRVTWGNLGADRRLLDPRNFFCGSVWQTRNSSAPSSDVDRRVAKMKLTNQSGVPVYTISGSSTARPLPEWLARRRKRSLKNDPEYANRVELLQDFEFEEASQCIRVSEDGQWVMSTGMPPVITPSFAALIAVSCRHL